MNIPTAEIADNRPIVSVSDLLASRLLQPALLFLFYLSTLLIGLYKAEYLADSTLIKLVSNVLGPCAAIMSGGIAYIMAFIVPHKYEFAQEVYNLSDYASFKIAISFTFLLFPLINFFTRAIHRTFTTYLFRKYIFIISITVSLILLYLINHFLNVFENKSSFVFSFTVFGIIYYAVFSCISNDYRARIQRMRNQ